MRSYGDTCPIAAQASQGALALIRTSGQGTLELLAKIFSRSKALIDAPGNTIVYGWILDSSGTPIDETLVSVYRSPRSYTGEDGADISCHGGIAAVKTILEILRHAGFEDALPGEFTFRSFMNGKIDLTRSESVMEVVSASTKQGLEHAVKRLSGALEREIKTIRDKLLEALSEAELFLDYPEDEIDEEPSLSYRNAAEEALSRLQSLTASYQRERLYREGALAVIAGRPNAGKSSLFNALLNEDRAIVHETPGTTRDWIEASVNIKGIPLRLVDTAGLRDLKNDSSAQEETQNEAEMQGIRRSRELTEEADIVLYTVDACRGITKEDEAFIAGKNENLQQSLVLVWNKIDLVRPSEIKNDLKHSLVPVSARTGEGLEELCTSIVSTLTQRLPLKLNFSDYLPEIAGLGTQRQKDLTEKSALLLKEALEMAGKKEPLDLIAPLLRESLNVLGEITGDVSSADILDSMFSRFCLGK